ncbi:MAG: M48 family metallopeptidase [Christensenellaceae bacterium]|jgi:predicted metal-dependent hydrolase|nr:M48 family metallopeptidase [Christensenellaceae bacterium]
MLDPRNIFRSNRKNLSLFVDMNGVLIAKAPFNLDERKIYDYVREKQDWILKRQEQIRKNSYLNKSVATYLTFMFLGKELSPIITGEVKNIEIRNGAILVPSKIEQDKILKKIEAFLKKQALIIIKERAEYFRQILRINPANISVNNNKTRWGVCDSKRNIILNWRCVMLPPNLLDYVLVHEFCHILEFNHTKNFWRCVQTILPDFKLLRAHLKNLGWLLELFRVSQ